MKRFLVAALLLFASVCAFGQGAALVFPPATNQNGGPVVFGTITFCSVPTTINALTGVCQTPVTVYKDQALTQPYSTIQTDGIGNFPPNFVTTTSLWFTVANTYCYTVTTTSMLSPATNPCVSFSVPIAGGSSPTFANLTVTGSLTAGAGTFTSVGKVVKSDGYATLALAVAAVPSGGTLDVAPNTTYALSASISLSQDIWIRCQNRSTSVITAPSGAAIFSLSGTIRQFHLIGCTLIGNGAGSKVADFTGVTASEGRLSVEDNIISTFPGDPITFGTSDYFINVERNTFVNDSGGVNIGEASDSWVRDNFFENTSGTGSGITVIGPNVHIVGNTFVRGSGTTTGPDILIVPFDATGNSGGYIWIEDNKFGNEATEINTRYKVQVNSATTSFAVPTVVMRGNNFLGVSGQTAIRLDNPIRNFSISDNYFGSFGATGTIVSDAFTAQVASFGQSVFANNRVMSNDACPTLFTNGGRGFWRIDVPENCAQLPIYHSVHETPELRNRIAAPSEDFTSSSWVKSNLTVTAGITDPYGTTRATTLTVASGTGNVSAVVTNTNMLNHMNVKLWLQAGTLSQARIGIKDTTAPANFQELPTVTLSSTWKLYSFDVYGLTPGHNHTINILLDAAGTINIFAPDVSDWGGDYIPTPSTSMVSDTASGQRLERKLQLGPSSAVVNNDLNGSQWVRGMNTELLTLSTSGSNTDTSGNLLPANSIIEAVVVRITTTIATATAWEVGDASQAQRFISSNSTLTAGTTAVGLNQADPTVASSNLGPVQTSAAKVRVTTTGTPSAGVIRITVFYRQFVAPTS